MICIIILLLIWIPHQSQSQSYQDSINLDSIELIRQDSIKEDLRDSLWSIWMIKENSNDDRVEALEDLCYSYLFENCDSLIKVSKLLLEFSTQKNLIDKQATSNNYLGLAYSEIGEYFLALNHYRETKILYTELKDSLGMAGTNINIASILLDVGDTSKAKKMYLDAYEIFKKMDSPSNVALAALNLGSFYSGIKDRDKFILYTKEAIQIIEQFAPDYNIEDAWHLATCYFNLAEDFTDFQKDSALLYYFEGLALCRKYEIKSTASAFLSRLSSIYRSDSSNLSALKYAKEAYQMAKESQSIEDIFLATEENYKLHKALGNTEKALTFYEEYKQLQDSISSLDKQREILLDIYQDARKKYQKFEKSKRINERVIISTISLILILIIAYFFRKKQLKLTVEQKLLLEEIKTLKDKSIIEIIVSNAEKQPTVTLDKNRIEETINGKLNQTDWKILNILYEDPTILNKTIAKKISLSVEGTSSSLRKMYRIFEIKDGKNKKMALLLKAIKISK